MLDQNDWKKPLNGIFKVAKFAKDMEYNPKYLFYTPIFSGFYIFISDQKIEAKNKDLNKTLFENDINYGKINHFERISLDSFLLTAENCILKVTISQDSFNIKIIQIPSVMFSFSYKDNSILVVLSNCSTKIIQSDETIKDLWLLNEDEKPNSSILFNEDMFAISTEKKIFIGKIESDKPVIHTFNQPINRLYKSTKDSLYVVSADETRINFISFDSNYNIVRSDTIINSAVKITGINIIYDNDHLNEEVFLNKIQKENDWKREMEGASYSILYCEKNVMYAYSSSNDQPLAMVTLSVDPIMVILPLKPRHFVAFSENGKPVLCRLTDEIDVAQRFQYCIMQNITGELPIVGCFSDQENSFVIVTENRKIVKWEQSIQWFHLSYC